MEGVGIIEATRAGSIARAPGELANRVERGFVDNHDVKIHLRGQTIQATSSDDNSTSAHVPSGRFGSFSLPC